VRKVEEILILNKIEEVCNYPSGVMFMLKNDQFQNLKEIYRLCARVKPTVKFIAKILLDFIIEIGLEFNNTSENKRNDRTKSSKEISIEYVSNVIQFFQKI
jgi:hypothetical protein